MSAPDYKDFDDAENVRRAARGELAAFDALVRQYTGMVFALGMARLDRDRERAEELAQEVFLRAYLNLHVITRPAFFPVWLVQVTRNLANDWQRKEQSSSALITMVSIDGPDGSRATSTNLSPREAMIQKQETEQLNMALGQMPAEERELLLLHYSEELSQSEIARRLGVHPSTVMRKLEQSVRRLRKIYKTEFATNLKTNRASGMLEQRTLAVILAAAGLSASQKAALAAAAPESFIVPAAISWLPQEFIHTFGGKLMIGTGAVTALAIGSLVVMTQVQQPRTLEIQTQQNQLQTPVNAITGVAPVTASRVIAQAKKDKTSRRVSHPAGRERPADLPSPISTRYDTSGTMVGAFFPTSDGYNLSTETLTGKLSGVVVSETGEVLPGARINLSYYTEGLAKVKQRPNEKYALKPQAVRQSRDVIANETGRFRLDNLTTSSAILRVTHAPYTEYMEVIQLPMEDLTVRLSKKNAALEGIVRDLATSSPIAGVTVIAWPSRMMMYKRDSITTNGETSREVGEPVTAKTDENGRYHLDGLPSGEIELNAEKADRFLMRMAESYEKVDVEKILENDLVMYPGFTIKGQVSDVSSSVPLSGVTVSKGDMFGMSPEDQVTTDMNGNYEITGIDFSIGSAGFGPSMTFLQLSVKASGYKNSTDFVRLTSDSYLDGFVIKKDISLQPE